MTVENHEPRYVSYKLLSCVAPDDVEQICCDHDVDVTIDDTEIVGTNNVQFLEGVLATLMFIDP